MPDQGSWPADCFTGDDDVQRALLLAHLVIEPVEVRQIGDVALRRRDVAADEGLGLIQLRLRRPVMKTWAPSSTKRRAAASPSPLLPRVMTAILPSSMETSCSGFFGPRQVSMSGWLV
jgi:hypothetical protein